MNRRNIAALELPAKLFGKARFKPGDTIGFHLLHPLPRRSPLWKGKFTLRE